MGVFWGFFLLPLTGKKLCSQSFDDSPTPAPKMKMEPELPLHWGVAGDQPEEVQESLFAPTRVYPSSHSYSASRSNSKYLETMLGCPWAMTGGDSQSWGETQKWKEVGM